MRGVALFLQATGERHAGERRQIEIGPVKLTALAEERTVVEFDFAPEGETDDGPGPLTGRVALRAEALGADEWRVKACVHNTSVLPAAWGADPDRAKALRASLVSTHAVLEVEGGRFISPLERDGRHAAAVEATASVNTFPVLAADDDTAILGAAIMLPDHPQIAPESKGNLFDNTEIEEALLLHVHALSDDEREEIGEQDPAVKAMIERAAATTAEDLLELHGRMRLTDVGAADSAELPRIEPAFPTPPRLAGDDDRPAHTTSPPAPPPGLDGTPGEEFAVVDGVTYGLGDTVVLKLSERTDPGDRMMDGRHATVERIFFDYEDKLYFGVTIDDQPGQEMLRETGRFLFFFRDEVERVEVGR